MSETVLGNSNQALSASGLPNGSVLSLVGGGRAVRTREGEVGKSFWNAVISEKSRNRRWQLKSLGRARARFR